MLAALATRLAAPCAQAQQAWQPFRPSLTYQLSESTTPDDTTHTLRLGAGTPDSLFHFTKRAGKISPAVLITWQ